MITVNNIAVEFSGKTLFKDINFIINGGDRIALMGKNGAGKSTMMKIIAGVEKPTRGNIVRPKEAVIAYLCTIYLLKMIALFIEPYQSEFQFYLFACHIWVV